MSITTDMKTVTVGSGRWIHATQDGKRTLCGATNLNDTQCDEVTCMKCIKKILGC
jgi:hypothetical protein